MARSKRWATFSLDPLAIITDPAFVAMSHPAQRAHLLLVLHAWNQKEPGVIPGPSSRFSFMLELTPEAWAEIEAQVAAGACITPDGSWTYPAMQKVYAAQERTHLRLSELGKRRSDSMWGNNLDSQAIAPQAIAPEAIASLAIAPSSSSSASSSASASETEKERTKPSVSGVDREGGGIASHEKAKRSRLWRETFAESFWPSYPRKVGKEAALRAWMKLETGSDEGNIERFSDIADGLAWYVREEWADREKSKIPHAATWLHQARWRDVNDGV